MFEEIEIPAQPEKRNCGRTGPTSPEGRAVSSKNAIKQRACARTLILPHESEEDWELLLTHWREMYQRAENSLAYDSVLRTAQAEWHRRRAQFNFDGFMASTEGGSAINRRPDQIKHHDLALRYKNSAERAFQREFRLPARAVLQRPLPQTRQRTRPYRRKSGKQGTDRVPPKFATEGFGARSGVCARE